MAEANPQEGHYDRSASDVNQDLGICANIKRRLRRRGLAKLQNIENKRAVADTASKITEKYQHIWQGVAPDQFVDQAVLS
ncbi:MAG: hypothetical protein M1835_002651 [Candelina submexicana]|nr:MAG: hypothetical protein M1835_002651 [Candelina submexicana]